MANEGARSFSQLIGNTPSLVSLDLRSCQIDDEGLLEIVSSLEGNSTLKSIQLWGNNFGQQSLKKLAELQEYSLKYTTLSLDVRSYPIDGVFHVCRQQES